MDNEYLSRPHGKANEEEFHPEKNIVSSSLMAKTIREGFSKDKSLEKKFGFAESRFLKFAKITSRTAGRASTFFTAVGIIAIWGTTGPLFHFSDTWQLVINTGTTIITFLMVFLIQNTQNRDSAAIQIKLDELIRSHQGAHNALLNLEELGEHELDQFIRKYYELAEKARKGHKKGIEDTDTPVVLFDETL